MKKLISETDLKKVFLDTRNRSREICEPLLIEDYGPQPEKFVSPPKWHLAHSTWFFEEFVLKAYDLSYREFHPDFSFLFNSYYNNLGDRIKRDDRGIMSRPSVGQVYQYRYHVDEAMVKFLQKLPDQEIRDLVELGINHEQQHQELLVYDIKYIFGNQPLKPIYGNQFIPDKIQGDLDWQTIEGGLIEVGAEGNHFYYDNEAPRHKVYLDEFQICSRLITNGEYLGFIEDGGYRDFNLWHDEGWSFIREKELTAPLYWELRDGIWHEYHMHGLRPLDKGMPVSHISFYEAFAFSQWAECRLPTEFEWECAAPFLNHGSLWEWTNSAYLPYPGFHKAKGAVGEYNAKFMMNQMVLRGGSIATPPGHFRKTYRNFFHPQERWLYCGIRLAK